jgi:Ankyrin repeats (3 copies)
MKRYVPDMPNRHADPVMWEVMKEGDMEGLRDALYQRLANPNSPEKKDGDTPLIFAARHSDLALAQVLVEAGADLSRRGGTAMTTPLHAAVWQGDLEMVKYLHKAGAPLNATNCWGNNALHDAFTCDKPEIAKYLLDTGVDFAGRNDLGMTPLQAAILSWKPWAAKMAIEYGADIYTLNNKDQTAKALAEDRMYTANYEIRNNIDGGEKHRAEMEEVLGYLKTARQLRSAHLALTTEFNAGSEREIKVMKTLKLESPRPTA